MGLTRLEEKRHFRKAMQGIEELAQTGLPPEEVACRVTNIREHIRLAGQRLSPETEQVIADARRLSHRLNAENGLRLLRKGYAPFEVALREIRIREDFKLAGQELTPEIKQAIAIARERSHLRNAAKELKFLTNNTYSWEETGEKAGQNAARRASAIREQLELAGLPVVPGSQRDFRIARAQINAVIAGIAQNVLLKISVKEDASRVLRESAFDFLAEDMKRPPELRAQSGTKPSPDPV